MKRQADQLIATMPADNEPAPIRAEWSEGCDNLRKEAYAAENRLVRHPLVEKELTTSDWRIIEDFVHNCFPNPEARTRESWGFFRRILGQQRGK